MHRAAHTLLIVDDSPEDRELYRRYLLRHDQWVVGDQHEHTYTFIEAECGCQGLELWEQHRPDAVLLDYRLPDMDGLDFLAQLQLSVQSSYLPVIVLTGQGNEAIAVQAMKAGAQDYLPKEQITPESLYLAVRGAIATVQLHTQLQQSIERERLVAQMTQKLYQTLDLEEILQTTVTDVRQFLQTDRVLIFRLKPPANSGTVVVESVRAGTQSILSSQIYDPCFAASYVERYRQGLATTKTDIYDGSVDPCHVELLAQFQVRSNLVLPILYEGQLWGLLIAHHCSAPRQWQPLETELLQQVAMQAGIAIRQAELYQAAQAQVAKLEQLNQLKDDFLSTVSHELRSPMASIKMATQMLQLSLEPTQENHPEATATISLDHAQTAKVTHYLQILHSECQRETRLINDLLDLTRLDAGTLSLALSEINLQVSVPQIAQAFKERTQQRQQHLQIDISDDLPLCTTDVLCLERILTELLENAYKYTPSDETIAIAIAAVATGVKITVSNSGVQIAAAERDRIFDKFYRVPNSDRWKHGGTGLGLALVKKLVSLLQGSIVVSSDSDWTTFTLTLPWHLRVAPHSTTA